MLPLGDTGRQLAVLFLLTCLQSNCADEILIQTFRNVGSNGSVPNMILQKLNRTDKLLCCLRCIERPGCLMLGVLPQKKCLLLGDHVQGTQNQSVIEEDGYVLYSYSSVTTSTSTIDAASSATTAASSLQSTNTTASASTNTTVSASTNTTVSASTNTISAPTNTISTSTNTTVSASTNTTVSASTNTISASTPTTSSTTLPSPSYPTDPDTTVTSSTTTTTSSTDTTRPDTHVPPSTEENTTPFFDPKDPFIESKYTVITQTGTEPDSETDCIVDLTVFGEHGLSKMLKLDHIDKDEMRRGANDTFTFRGHRNLGKLSRMQLRVMQYGLKGGWLVIGVEVKRERVYQHYRHVDTYYSYLNKWFQSLEISLETVANLLYPAQTIDFKPTSDYFEKL